MILLLLTHAFKKVKVKVWHRQIKQVTCDQCATAYAYEMIRHADGGAMHVVFVGHEAARNRARQSGDQQSSRLAREESEMVPGPQCGWVNDHLTRAFGWWRYSPSAAAVIVLTVLGFGTSCLMPALVSLPLAAMGANQAVQATAAVVTLFACFLLPLWVCLYGWIRRGLMRPNRHYPGGLPVVPPGTPMPMLSVGEDHTGQVVYQRVPMEMRTGIKPRDGLVVHIQDCVFPPSCCCCLADANPYHRVNLQKYFAEDLFVPVCDGCIRRQWLWRGLVGFQGIALIAVGVGLVYNGMWYQQPLPWLLAYPGVVMAWVVGVQLHYFWRVRPCRFKVLDVHRGICLFKPRDRDYIGLMLDAQDAAGEALGTGSR